MGPYNLVSLLSRGFPVRSHELETWCKPKTPSPEFVMRCSAKSAITCLLNLLRTLQSTKTQTEREKAWERRERDGEWERGERHKWESEVRCKKLPQKGEQKSSLRNSKNFILLTLKFALPSRETYVYYLLSLPFVSLSQSTHDHLHTFSHTSTHINRTSSLTRTHKETQTRR